MATYIKQSNRLVSRWRNYAKSLNDRIDSAKKIRDLPSNDDMDFIVRLTDKAFGNTSFYRYYVEDNKNLRDKWLTKLRYFEKIKKDKEDELLQREKQVPLSDENKVAVEDILSRIAQEFKICDIDSVDVVLQKDAGIIKFKTAENIGDEVIDVIQQGGVGTGITINDIPKDELETGQDIESEHVKNNPILSPEQEQAIEKEIILDHEKESIEMTGKPEYYEHLTNMEEDMKKEKHE